MVELFANEPPNVVALARHLEARGNPLQVVRHDSDLNQLLRSKVGKVVITVVADRGRWAVTLETPRSGNSYAVGIWRAVARGVPLADPDGNDLPDDDLEWLLEALDDRSLPRVRSERLRDTQTNTVSRRTGIPRSGLK